MVPGSDLGRVQRNLHDKIRTVARLCLHWPVVDLNRIGPMVNVL